MRRTEIKGRLVLQSPLCIGSGQTWADHCIQNPHLWGTPIRDGYAEDNVQLVQRDATGLPLIPGTTLKNAVRRALVLLQKNRGGVTEGQIGKLVGNASGINNASGGVALFRAAYVSRSFMRSGKRIENAPTHLPWYDSHKLTFIEQCVAIDHRTGTQMPHRLFSREYVAPGTVFDVRILIDDPSDDQALPGILLKALSVMNLDFRGSPFRMVAIGADVVNGCGAVRWRCDKVERLSFLKTPVAHEQSVDPLPAKLLADGLAISIGLKLAFRGPFFVRDSAYRSEKGNVDHKPRQSGKGGALLPATGFRGVFRSAIERIVRTMNSDTALAPDELNAGEIADFSEPGNEPAGDQGGEPSDPIQQALQALLGSTSHRSGLWISDFASVGNSKMVTLQMIGIDRLTGGVAPGKTFDVEAFDSPILSGSLLLRLKHASWNPIALGLVILALRDLIEGDLSFGAGIYRGFGACTTSITAVHVSGLPGDKVQRAALGLVGDADLAESTLNLEIANWIKKKADVLKLDSLKLDSLINACLNSLNCLNGEFQDA